MLRIEPNEQIQHDTVTKKNQLKILLKEKLKY